MLLGEQGLGGDVTIKNGAAVEAQKIQEFLEERVVVGNLIEFNPTITDMERRILRRLHKRMGG